MAEASRVGRDARALKKKRTTMVLSRQVGPRWRSVVLLTVGAAVSLAVMVWAVGKATPQPTVAGQAVEEGERGNDDPTVLDNDGRFTGPGEVWPPQPKDATDIVNRSAAEIAPEPQAERLAALDAVAPAEQAPSDVVAGSAEVQAAIGENSNLIAVEETNGSTQMIWFSLSNNQTVDAVVEGGAVSTLLTLEPGTFQPELSDAEKLAAVDIARAHWVSKGDRRIDGLQGYSILAFQPGGAYYETRMVYVSFHIDEDSRPELLAWVDLVTGDVVKSEVDR